KTWPAGLAFSAPADPGETAMKSQRKPLARDMALATWAKRVFGSFRCQTTADVRSKAAAIAAREAYRFMRSYLDWRGGLRAGGTSAANAARSRARATPSSRAKHAWADSRRSA